eukprot:158138-Chlamydomonas_euryale.AAC.2
MAAAITGIPCVGPRLLALTLTSSERLFPTTSCNIPFQRSRLIGRGKGRQQQQQLLFVHATKTRQILACRHTSCTGENAFCAFIASAKGTWIDLFNPFSSRLLRQS